MEIDPSMFVIADSSLVIASVSEAISLGTGCVKQSRNFEIPYNGVDRIEYCDE